ncbi:MAG: FtsX-like permease family protein [Cryomorphaceae bacterium]
MQFEWFIARKMIGGRTSGQSRGSSAIVKIAVAGIAIGMAVMLLSVSIVRGFQEEVRQKVIGFGAHLQVSYYNPQNTLGIRPMNAEQAFVPAIQAEPAVKNIQSYAYKSGIITANGEIQGVMSKGIGRDFDWDFFDQNMVEGRSFRLPKDDESDSIVISTSIVNKLNLSLGDKVTVSYFQDENERKRRFVIGGIYETGMEQFDGSVLLCDIRHIQKLNGWEDDQVAGFEVVLHSFEDLDYLDQIIANHITYEFNTLKITDQFMEIFGWLELQDINVIIILSLMVLVSGINMISALLVIILERTNMIGLLKSMGAHNASIGRIFLLNATYLILIGLLIGNVLGLGIGWLQQEFELIKLDQANYYVDHVPVLFQANTILLINLGSMLACLFMLILPSMIVSRIDPVKTIKFN